MKRFLFGLLGFCCLFASTAMGGGPDMEMDKAHIDDVVIAEGRAVLRVTGTVKFSVLKTTEDDAKDGNAKWVTMVMNSGEIRCHQRLVSFGKFDWYEDYLKELQKLKGTDQHLQMWGTSAIVEMATVTHITAVEMGAWPPDKPKTGSTTEPSDETKPPTPPSSPRTP